MPPCYVVLCRRYAFFDTDSVIELAHPGESVADIFKKYGEDYFRNCESQVSRSTAHHMQALCCYMVHATA